MTPWVIAQAAAVAAAVQGSSDRLAVIAPLMPHRVAIDAAPLLVHSLGRLCHRYTLLDHCTSRSEAVDVYVQEINDGHGIVHVACKQTCIHQQMGHVQYQALALQQADYGRSAVLRPAGPSWATPTSSSSLSTRPQWWTNAQAFNAADVKILLSTAAACAPMCKYVVRKSSLRLPSSTQQGSPNCSRNLQLWCNVAHKVIHLPLDAPHALRVLIPLPDNNSPLQAVHAKVIRSSQLFLWRATLLPDGRSCLSRGFSLARLCHAPDWP